MIHSDHNSFGGIGMAQHDRIDLFRGAALKSLGANARRFSHNPGSPNLLDVYDRIGVLAMDENRVFGDNPADTAEMAAMVKRDRRHPSVFVWSYCNEVGCAAKGAEARAVVEALDGTRPTLGNRYDGPMDQNTDVEGFSHSHGEVFDKFHFSENRTKPF